MARFIIYDITTGNGSGGDPSRHSLLTAYFCVLDNTLQVIDDLEIKIASEDGIYKVTSAVTFDAKAHALDAISSKTAYSKLAHFLTNQLRDIREKRFVIVVNPRAKSFITPQLTRNAENPLNLDTTFLNGEEISLASLLSVLKMKGCLPEMLDSDPKNVAALFGLSWDESSLKAKTLSNIRLLKTTLSYVAGPNAFGS